ncbi:hypothetical protein PVW48_06500 [Dinoroseobacter sp. PD6]|uniref:hypothetical protein n=1 Tax=Dinoroseobacter sp. PD6 TaxID=3028384 RepID=UPI00237C1863|nr:hypothetical protein [Dinoroseobacter sp. PD6]MDD9716386.1 hypothetical protein [Dinoroseobacter sp. PD6]
MATLTLDRPAIAEIASSIFDAVLYVPARVAHAHEMRAEIEHVMALTDAEIGAMQTTRETLLRNIAQRV